MVASLFDFVIVGFSVLLGVIKLLQNVNQAGYLLPWKLAFVLDEFAAYLQTIPLQTMKILIQMPQTFPMHPHLSIV